MGLILLTGHRKGVRLNDSLTHSPAHPLAHSLSHEILSIQVPSNQFITSLKPSDFTSDDF